MPRIDFYILEETSAQARLALACRLIEKAHKNRHRVYINTSTPAQAHQLDELLWTYRDDSFLPHNLYGEGPEPAPPIQIGCQLEPSKHRDILLNLSDEIPVYFTQFNRILEIVSNEPTLQNIGREHYRHYRASGHEISTHKLATVE
jgi:DNA polymerase-3 subunit chi